ncbi:MAG: transmembrane protein 254 [Microscillaceae bacterium]|nr:transmembrane protein 254 [Microscillaceae bacterium]MDW8460197.1 DUF4499 domain-containing protein [Cytophagales bacterium]
MKNALPSDSYFQTPPPWWYVFALGGVSTLAIFAFMAPLSVLLPYQKILKSLFLLVGLIHLLEAIYAYWLASKSPLKSKRWQWTCQTLFLGIYSLILLKRLVKKYATT